MKHGVPVLFILALLCTITSAYCLHMEAHWNERYDELSKRTRATWIGDTAKMQEAKDNAEMYGDLAVVSLAGGFLFEALLFIELVRDQRRQRSIMPSDPVRPVDAHD